MIKIINLTLKISKMSFIKFTCRDNTYDYPSICRGTNISTGLHCKNRPSDINGFCNKHYSQSIIYAKNNTWSVISSYNSRGIEVLTKVPGIVPGAVMTSEKFGK